MMNCAVLMTCHNRRRITIACLARLFAAANTPKPRLSIHVYLVNDGCTDGTNQDVRAQFPEVTIINGTGSLYWCGGMRLAWATAAKNKHDSYLWLNDDVMLNDEALNVLYETHEQQKIKCAHAGIVVGSTASENSGAVSYGAWNRASLVPPCQTPIKVKLFNGNLVLVSDSAFRIIGNLDSFYSHSFGDLDYGLRAEQKGIPVWLAPGYLGTCEKNPTPKWQRADVPFVQRFKALHHPTGCRPWELAYLLWRHNAWCVPFSVLRLYLKVFFPETKALANKKTDRVSA